MNKDQSAQKYLDIPGEKTLVYTFKFNMDLPPPVPPPKTMYVPLDPERYIKPKLTLFHVKKKVNLMADINLSIPVDDVNMRPELYNPPPDAKFELSEKDRELLEEKPAKEIKKEAPAEKPQNTNGKNQAAGQKEKAKPHPTAGKDGAKQGAEAGHAKKTEGSQPKKKEDIKKLPIDEYVKKTFEIASSYTVGSKHPHKEELECEEVFEIVPDLEHLITEIFAVKAEVSAETLKTQQNLIKFETDLDKKPILAVYTHAPLAEEGKKEGNMEEEENKEEMEALLKRVENFEHLGNYVYSQPKKELLLNVNKSNGKVFIYQTQPLVLKKKKVLFMNKTVLKEDDMEEEKKVKERKKTVKILRRDVDKDDLLEKKKKLKELQLENSSYYKKNSQALEKYKEDEKDELEMLRKRFAVEEEEEEAEEQEKEEDEEEKGERRRNDDDEEEAQFNEEKDEDEEKEKEESQREQEEEEEKGERKMEVEEEEQQYNPDSPKETKNEKMEEAKKADKGSDEDSAKELADFFADSDDDE